MATNIEHVADTRAELVSNPASSYETDFYAWTQKQAALLRAHCFDKLDLVNLIEEIESLGRAEKRELESRLKVLVIHLLKWQFQANKIRRLPEKNIPYCAGFLFGFKARRRAHSALCNGRRNAEAEQKDQQDGMFFDRNRLSSPDGSSASR